MEKDKNKRTEYPDEFYIDVLTLCSRDSGFNLSETISKEPNLKEQILYFKNQLSEKRQRIIDFFYLDGMRKKEIAVQLGVSYECVRTNFYMSIRTLNHRYILLKGSNKELPNPINTKRPKDTFFLKYPLNLYADVFDILSKDDVIMRTQRISDLGKSVGYALSEFTKEEREIISLRYKGFNSLPMIAKECELSLDAVSKTIEKVCKKLSDSEVFRIGLRAALQKKSGTDLPCKIGQRVFVIIPIDSKNGEYIVIPCTVNCIIIIADNVQVKCNETGNQFWIWGKYVFSSAEKAEETKNQLVKQTAEGAKQNV